MKEKGGSIFLDFPNWSIVKTPLTRQGAQVDPKSKNQDYVPVAKKVKKKEKKTI